MLPLLGVSFLLNVDQDEYLGSIDDVAGLVAVIHDQNTVPFPEDEGLAIHPGELLSIGVKKVKQNRLPHPPTVQCIPHCSTALLYSMVPQATKSGRNVSLGGG